MFHVKWEKMVTNSDRKVVKKHWNNRVSENWRLDLAFVFDFLFDHNIDQYSCMQINRFLFLWVVCLFFMKGQKWTGDYDFINPIGSPTNDKISAMEITLSQFLLTPQSCNTTWFCCMLNRLLDSYAMCEWHLKQLVRYVAMNPRKTMLLPDLKID